MHWEPISDKDRGIIARQLQREPRNLCGIARRCQRRCPQVIVNNPLPETASDAYFFPTVFWLTCPEAIRRISRLEDQGYIRQIQARLKDHQHVRENLQDAHVEYIFIRRRLLGRERLLAMKSQEQTRALTRNLELRGVGGSADLLSVKCLHMHYAHFLATRTNPVGLLVSKTLEFTGEDWRCDQCAATLQQDESRNWNANRISTPSQCSESNARVNFAGVAE